MAASTPDARVSVMRPCLDCGRPFEPQCGVNGHMLARATKRAGGWVEMPDDRSTGGEAR